MQELFIDKRQNKKIIALVENGKLKEIYEEDESKKRLEGNIYIGKVKDVLPGMQSAFIDIGEGKNTFMHIRDMIPKKSKITGNKQENLNKYEIQEYIQVNNSILVQVQKDSVSTKGARVTKNIQIARKICSTFNRK